MATKKQKRAAALAKREQFLKEVRESGLEAQKKDQEYRRMQDVLFEEEIQVINDRHREILSRHGIHEG